MGAGDDNGPGASLLKTGSSERSTTFRMEGNDSITSLRSKAPTLDSPPSAKVTGPQRRVSGVLPIAVNVPRTGNA